MGTHPNHSDSVRFGVFELDRRAGELHKNGLKVHLQGQPFQILAELVERPGEVVTREDLRQKLWADDTFVDFDQGLNRAVNKIREALGDSATSPRFLETLPKRGYRFIAPVEGPAKADSEPASPTAPVVQPRATRKLQYAGAVVLAAAVILGGVAGSRFFGPNSPEPQASLEAVPLTGYEGDEWSATFSPDGSQLAFNWNGAERGDFDIYVKTIGSESRRQLTDNPAEDALPRWSPDGRYIAFARYQEGGYFGERHFGENWPGHIFLIPPTGGERGLTAVFSLRDLVWSPDSRSLFVSGKIAADDPPGIYSFSIETGRKTAITVDSSDEPEATWDVSLSPDGQMLAFLRGPRESSSRVFVLPISGGQPLPVTRARGYPWSLAWTASGKEIIFPQGYGDGSSSRLWRVSVAGGEPRLLAGVGDHGLYPVISHNSGRMAYARVVSDGNLWRFSLPGPQQEPEGPQKLFASTQNEYTPQMSPDGNRIAFTSTRSGFIELWVGDGDGTNLGQLTQFGGRDHEGPEPAMPRWSPDGKQIAFDCDDPGPSWDIFVIDVEGGRPRRVTTYEGNDSRPAWSRDGKWLYFTSDRGGEFQIWKTPVDGGAAVPVTEGGGYHSLESPDGRYVYYGRSTEPGIWRVPVGGGEEVLVVPEVKSSGAGGHWDVTGHGIYFVEGDFATQSQRAALKFFRFNTGEITHVMDLGRPSEGGGALDVSPDGKWFLYSQIDHGGADLMLVENFR